MIRSFIFVGALSFFSSIQAQVKDQRLWAMPEVGIQIGAQEPSLDFRFQGGIQRKNWIFGAGVGADLYRFSSTPVYAQVRKLFHFRGTTPFLLASGGYNFKQSSDTVSTWIGPRIYDRSGGYYGEFGGGFVFRVFKKEKLSLSVVKNIKQVKESYDNDYWLGPGQTRSSRTTNLYTMHRAVIRLGWRF